MYSVGEGDQTVRPPVGAVITRAHSDRLYGDGGRLSLVHHLEDAAIVMAADGITTDHFTSASPADIAQALSSIVQFPDETRQFLNVLARETFEGNAAARAALDLVSQRSVDWTANIMRMAEDHQSVMSDPSAAPTFFASAEVYLEPLLEMAQPLIDAHAGLLSAGITRGGSVMLPDGRSFEWEATFINGRGGVTLRSADENSQLTMEGLNVNAFDAFLQDPDQQIPELFLSQLDEIASFSESSAIRQTMEPVIERFVESNYPDLNLRESENLIMQLKRELEAIPRGATSFEDLSVIEQAQYLESLYSTFQRLIPASPEQVAQEQAGRSRNERMPRGGQRAEPLTWEQHDIWQSLADALLNAAETARRDTSERPASMMERVVP